MALPVPPSCCSPGARSTRGWHGEGFGQVMWLGGVSSCCGTTSFARVSASKKSRRPLLQLRAAQRPCGWALLAHKTENLRDQSVTSPDSRMKVTTKHLWVVLASVQVASPETQGTQPARVTGRRVLAPPAEEQEAMPAANGTLCRNFLSGSGMRAVWPCANLSVGCKHQGKQSLDGGDRGHHAVPCTTTLRGPALATFTFLRDPEIHHRGLES